MRLLAPPLAGLFAALVLASACSSESKPPLLGDCLEPECRGNRVPSPSPATNNQPTAGRGAGGGGSMPSGTITDAGLAIPSFPEAAPGVGVGSNIPDF